MRHLFYCDTVGTIGSVGLLLLRLVMGAAFLFHGWPKIQNPLGWMGPECTVPGILQALAALAEFGGGMALIVGLLTRLASLGIAAVMVVALGMVHLPTRRSLREPEGCLLRTGRRLPCLCHPVPALGTGTILAGRPPVQQARRSKAERGWMMETVSRTASTKRDHRAQLGPNWITKPPTIMRARPTQVEDGTVSLKASRPQRTLTAAKNAT